MALFPAVSTAEDLIVVADKKAGTMYILDRDSDTRIATGPALYGKRKGDSLDFDYYDSVLKTAPYITPAGTFKLTKYYSTRLKKNVLVFIEGNNILMAIHSVYTGNVNQQRVERLQTSTASDNKITNGCINVTPEFFKRLDELPPNTTLIVLPDN